MSNDNTKIYPVFNEGDLRDLVLSQLITDILHLQSTEMTVEERSEYLRCSFNLCVANLGKKFVDEACSAEGFYTKSDEEIE